MKSYYVEERTVPISEMKSDDIRGRIGKIRNILQMLSFANPELHKVAQKEIYDLQDELWNRRGTEPTPRALMQPWEKKNKGSNSKKSQKPRK